MSTNSPRGVFTFKPGEPRNKIIIIFGGIGLFVSLLFAVVGFLVGRYAFPDSSGPLPANQHDATGSSTNPPGIASGQLDAEPTPTSSPSNISTMTITYPAMTSVQRLPVVDLDKPTFEIDSSVLEMKILITDCIPRIEYAKVTFLLNAPDTEQVQLRCNVLNGDIDMIQENGTKIPLNSHVNEETHILTIDLPPTVDKTNLTLQLSYMPSDDAFEKFIFYCGSQKCSVFVNRKLSFLVPHFHELVKHSWSFIVHHPQNVKVLTNSKASNTSTAIFSDFPKTESLLPNEISFVVMENLEKSVFKLGAQVESYYSTLTNAHEVHGLVEVLETGIQSQTDHPTLAQEAFFIVVVPSKDNYELYGRNIAVIGENLLNSNKEIMLDFVWRWIFRMIIYEKTTSSDNNPTWIYDHSAVFLSTSVVSAKKDIWKKHHFELSMERGRRIMTKGFNRSIIYEDELRYLENPAFVGKVSTVLGILTSAGTNENPLTKLDGVRDKSTSNKFFFVKSDIQLVTGQKIQVDKFTSCYMDSLDMPRLHISRFGPSSVVIKRVDGGRTDRCDIILWYVKAVKGGSTTKKEQIMLREKDQQIEIQTESPILFAGDVPSYYYTMDEEEFNRVQNDLASYDKSSVEILFSNSFKAAEEGKLSYESLDNFMKSALQQKIVTADEAVDSLMSTVFQSRNDKLTNNIQMIIDHVLKAERNPTSSPSVAEYVHNRFVKSVNEDPLFEIEKVKILYKNCGENCLRRGLEYYTKISCAVHALNNCTYNPNLVEMFFCSEAVYSPQMYTTRLESYEKCFGKSCILPTLRGLLCTRDKAELDRWFDKAKNLEETDVMNRQVVETTIKGLASNDVSKSMLFPYLMKNWHLLHKKYSKFPSLLGSLVDSIASTISSREQLDEFKSFVNFHGQNLDMFKEFQEQIVKTEKWIEWNDKYSEEFNRVFVA